MMAGQTINIDGAVEPETPKMPKTLNPEVW
jgi:hypothetical protein